MVKLLLLDMGGFFN